MGDIATSNQSIGTVSSSAVDYTPSPIAMDAFSINNNSTAGTAGAGLATQSEMIVNMGNTKKCSNDDDDKVTILNVFRKTKLLLLSIFLIFFVTFLPFPGMLVTLESEYQWIQDKGWMPVFLVLIYNLSDYIGRQFVAAYTTFSLTKRTLWIGCALRFLLCPMFVLLYEGTIRNDWIAFGSTALLGITNGHLCCLCFMWAPSLVTAKEQPLMGSMMSFGLVMGIVLASNITLLLNSVNIL